MGGEKNAVGVLKNCGAGKAKMLINLNSFKFNVLERFIQGGGQNLIRGEQFPFLFIANHINPRRLKRKCRTRHKIMISISDFQKQSVPATIFQSPACLSELCWVHVKGVTRARRCANAEHQILRSRESFKHNLIKPLCEMGSKSDGAVKRKEENALCM